MLAKETSRALGYVPCCILTTVKLKIWNAELKETYMTQFKGT